MDSWYWGSICSSVWLWMEHFFAQRRWMTLLPTHASHTHCALVTPLGSEEGQKRAGAPSGGMPFQAGATGGIGDHIKRQTAVPSSTTPPSAILLFSSPVYLPFPTLLSSTTQFLRRAACSRAHLLLLLLCATSPFIVFSLLHWTIHILCHRIPVCLSFTFADDPIYLRIVLFA